MKTLCLAVVTAAIAAIIIPLSGSAKKKQPLPEKPALERITWNVGLLNSDGSVADSTQMWIARPLPGRENGTAVVMIPGGAYGFVSMQNEGYDWLDWLTDQGYTVGILNYRLPHGNPTLPLDDAQRAVGYFKQHAPQLNLSPDRVGVMGFSAGGHLAATAAVTPAPDARPLRVGTTLSDPRPIAARPDFQILVYPVISMTPQLTHSDSRCNLLGRDATPEMVMAYSAEQHVDTTTPPALIIATNDDTVVNPTNSITYYQALTNAGVPVSLHIYPSGGHGFGFSTTFPSHNQMLTEISSWLQPH